MYDSKFQPQFKDQYHLILDRASARHYQNPLQTFGYRLCKPHYELVIQTTIIPQRRLEDSAVSNIYNLFSTFYILLSLYAKVIRELIIVAPSSYS